eukprot:TRINITY_DN3021_c0_g1_i3.p1 TRINITY_DN3021_c0_g1~~TRINITY_DN3021_c0_g1_i3.p1  ORF type:complete len:227 (-),score=67.21 TRINITY_DN3021_c0_g1_i3:206-886(-)
MSECISGPPASHLTYVNGSESSKIQHPFDEDPHSSHYGGPDDSSVFDFSLPSRPPKPPHLSTVKDLIKNVPPDVSRELKPGRSHSIHANGSMTMGPPVPKSSKPSLSTSSLTMPRTWSTNTSYPDEGSPSEPGSRRNSSQEEQIYYYISTIGSSDNLPPVIIPAESFENKSIAYIDLEHPDTPERTQPPPCNNTSSIVYKTVDFIKTNAFNRTRENVEARYDEAQA